MKKLLAVLLAVMMLLTLTACKSKEQRAADKLLKETEALVEDLTKAIEDEDTEKIEKLMEDSEDLGERYQEVLEDLTEADEEAAEEFTEAYTELATELAKAMLGAAGSALAGIG